jgi:hypothetical protein
MHPWRLRRKGVGREAVRLLTAQPGDDGPSATQGAVGKLLVLGSVVAPMAAPAREAQAHVVHDPAAAITRWTPKPAAHSAEPARRLLEGDGLRLLAAGQLHLDAVCERARFAKSFAGRSAFLVSRISPQPSQNFRIWHI